MAELDQITVATHRYIRKTPKLIDLIFQNDPLLAYLKLNVREDYDGGRFIGENFNSRSSFMVTWMRKTFSYCLGC